MYKRTPDPSSIIRVRDGACIPADPANTDFAEYLQWVSAGNTPDPADPPAAPTVAQQIADLERQAGMVKAVRKFMLTAMEAEAIKQGAAQGLTSAQALALLRSKNAGYAGVKALDEQIEALEALL